MKAAMTLAAACAAVYVGASAGVSPEWIKPRTGSYADADVGVFRKAFPLDGAIRRAELRVAALGAFEAKVNGKVLPGYLNGGFTQPEKCRHEYSFDVTSALSGGGRTNVVEVEVSASWWRDEIMRRDLVVRRAGYPRDSALRTTLSVEFADGRRVSFASDRSWDATYGGRTVRAGIFEGEVQNLMHTDYRWEKAVPCDDFSGEVRPMRGPWISLREDLAMRPREPLPARLLPGREYVFDFGQNAAAVERMVVKGNRLAKVTVRHAEMLNEPGGDPARGNDGPGGTLYQANLRFIPASSSYVLRDGEQTLMPRFTFFGYRYVGISVTMPVVLKSLESVPVTSIAREAETSSFETGDPSVNKLVSNILWGFRSNYLSVPTDCPQRNERLGWTADTMVFTRAASYLADVRGFLGKWLADLRDTQSADGAYEQLAPLVWSASHRQATSGWSDAGVLVPYFLWRHYGDSSAAEENWESMKRYIAYLVAHNGSDRFCYGDWLAIEHRMEDDKSPYPVQNDEYRRIFSAFYWVWDAMAMREMAEGLGKTADAAQFADVERRARAYFASKYVGADGMVHERLRGQTVDLYMLKLGLCRDAAARGATRRDLVDNIRGFGNRLRTGFMGTAILMDTLTDIGETELAYTLLLQHGNPSWLYSVDQGATTVWERWDSYTKERGFSNADMNSFNHYAYGAVYAWMMGTVAGIRPGKDGGFDRFVLAPIPDARLGHATATYRTKNGTIVSSWRYEGGKCFWRFEVPKGSVAMVMFGGKTKEYGEGKYDLVAD
ncbi:MAG: family 78 glycoside hydrolase catalytic domain [Kiritimatiellae bacterium]|nr:family 78 glycoside hydrolase catalytic domain [Kiritimatiellia bacterium]